MTINFHEIISIILQFCCPFLAGLFIGTAIGKAKTSEIVKRIIKKSSKRGYDKLHKLEKQTNALLDNCLEIIAKYERMIAEEAPKTPQRPINYE